MEGKYINARSVNIFYLEKNPEGRHCIFFLHGNSSSHNTWKFQFESPILSQYRLVAFDLPAHGYSDAASHITDGYSLPGMASLMAGAILQLSGSNPYLLVGVSLGTNIIAEMMLLNIKPAGILFAGPSIFNAGYLTGRMAIPGTKIAVFFQDDLSEEDIQDMEELAYNFRSEEKTKVFHREIGQVKSRFRSSLLQTVTDGKYKDEIESIRTSGLPVCIIVGEDDQAYFSDYLDGAGLPAWNNEIIKIKGAGHWVHLDEPEKFTRLLSDYAEDIFKSIDA